MKKLKFDDIKDYDPINNRLTVDKNYYYDIKGKAGVYDDSQLRDYILNIYLTMMTRGIKGTYVYACNENLREYFKRFF